MTADDRTLLDAFEAIFGPQDWRDTGHDDPFIGPDVDLFVSESDAAHRQQRYDNLLERDAS